MNKQLARRELLVGSGIAVLAAAGGVQLVAAKTTGSGGMTETERANVKLVKEFLNTAS